MANKKRLLLALTLCGIGTVVVFGFLVSYLGGSRSELVVINLTGKDIISGKIWISPYPFQHDVGHLKDQDSLKLEFNNFSDGHYAVILKFENEETFSDSDGYVTHGMTFNDRMVFTQRGDSIIMKLDQIND